MQVFASAAENFCQSNNSTTISKTGAKLMARHRKCPRFPRKAKLKYGKKVPAAMTQYYISS